MPIWSPTVTANPQLIHDLLRNQFMPESVRNALLTQLMQRSQIQEKEVEGGIIQHNPLTGQTNFVSKPQTFKTKVGDMDIETLRRWNPQSGEYEVEFLMPGAKTGAGAGGAGTASGAGGGTLSPGFGGGIGPMPNTMEGIQTWLANKEAEKAGAIESRKHQMEVAWKPVEEAQTRGGTAQKEWQMLNAMEMLSQQTPAALSGPMAGTFLNVMKGIDEVVTPILGTPIFGNTAPAEGITKLQSGLASLATREITNRPALAEFKSVMAANPGLENTPEGRAMLIDIMKQGAVQDVEMSREAGNVQDPRQWPKIRDAVYERMPLVIHYKGEAYDTTKKEDMQRFGKTVKAEPPATVSGGTTTAPGGTPPAKKKMRYNPANDKFEPIE